MKWCPTCSLEARLTLSLFLCNRKPGLKAMPLAWPIAYRAAGVLSHGSLWPDVLLKYSSIAKIMYIVVQPSLSLFILQRFTLWISVSMCRASTLRSSSRELVSQTVGRSPISYWRRYDRWVFTRHPTLWLVEQSMVHGVRFVANPFHIYCCCHEFKLTASSAEVIEEKRTM